MSRQYDYYLEQHKGNVAKAFNWIKENLPELIVDMGTVDYEHQICFLHDHSKSQSDEYEAYDAYFYGGNRSYQVVQNFNHAWVKHIHRNPHHWQHWILLNDDPNEGEIILDMPYNYILEMICDWWAFSWNKGNLREIFDWWNEHRDWIKLSNKTRETVVTILDKIDKKLIELEDTEEDEDVLAHHGIKGQKWGVKNGPPYPLDAVGTLSKNMKSFEYTEFTTLKDHDWVAKNKKGSCHDQVMYELKELRKCGLDPKADFIIQVDDKGQGYQTHSFVHYELNGKHVWFENAWGNESGIHIYNSYDDMKKDIENKMKNDGPEGINIDVVWGTFDDTKVKPGDDLQTIVDKCLN